MYDYNALMAIGHESVGKGDFDGAMRSYESAYTFASTPSVRAATLQCMGIALRLSGKLEASEHVLLEAEELAVNDTILLARIKRDLAMTILDILTITPDRKDKRSFWDVDKRLHESLEALRSTDPIEASATIGFMARSMFFQGEKQAAVRVLREAHKRLSRKHDVYELNNLVWLARLSAPERWLYAPRAFNLIRRTGNTRRALEYVVILVGGNRLYMFLGHKTRK